jgi:RimJ/RimL family protein N-acetyltransferase
MTPLVPLELETSRLRLRQFEAADVSSLHAYYGDAESTRYTYGRALSGSATWHAVAGMAGHWQLRGYGPYAVVSRDDDEVIGAVGLWYPPDWPEPEIKWAMVPARQGQGYASEAARAVQAMARQALPQLRLISFIDARNEASIRLALALGAQLESEVEFRGGPWHIYRHPR